MQRFFSPQSEPSLVPGTPVFENLVLGFDAFDAQGVLVARCVDDLTIQDDLNREAPGLPGWYRILSDDARLVRLAARHCDADAPLDTVLDPLARLFGVDVVQEEGDVFRLSDVLSAPIALATSLPGERERPCELITPPIEQDHLQRLADLLAVAKGLGFTVPKEAAVHIHFDAARLCDARAFARLVEATNLHGKALRRAVKTNPNCRRLAPNPRWLGRAVASPAFQVMDWASAREALREQTLSKYCDFNFLNMVHDIPGKHTFEVRILPGSIDAQEIHAWYILFEAILRWCVDAPASARPEPKFERFLDALGLEAEARGMWSGSGAGRFW